MLRESDVPLLLFSRSTALDYVHLLVGAGAPGVLGTDAEAATVVAATRAVAAFERYVPPDLREPLMRRMLSSERPRYLTLSPRERAVVGRAARGDTIATIARLLVISDSTAKTHLRAAYSKLGVHDRAGAALELVGLGMLSAAGAAA
jgi:DNA-binding NarL/FixJ family response regulator